MARVAYLFIPKGAIVISPLDMADKKLVSLYQADGNMVVARYGTNKSTLKKLLKKEVGNA